MTLRRVIAASALALAMMPALANFDEAAFSQGSFGQESFQIAELVMVPDCSGDDEATCVATVEGAGFTTSVVMACSNTVAVGNVIGTAPPGGSEAEAGSAVVIRVSDGTECKVSRGRRMGVGLGIGLN